MGILSACMSTYVDIKDEKWYQTPLRLELEVTVSCHIFSGNQTWVLWNSNELLIAELPL